MKEICDTHKTEMKEIHTQHKLEIRETAKQAVEQASQHVFEQFLKQSDETPRGKTKQKRSQRPITPSEATDEHDDSDGHCSDYDRSDSRRELQREESESETEFRSEEYKVAVGRKARR